VIQKSALNGSQGGSGVIVDDGIDVGGSAVFVGITLVFTTTGVFVTSVRVQETRANNRKNNAHFGVSQLADAVLEV
jgi:hypothetical protein